MFFVLNGKFCGLNTAYINDYNELLKKSPNPSRQQIPEIMTNFFMKKKKNKNEGVIVKLTTYYNLLEKEKENVAIVLTKNRAYFDNLKLFYDGFYKRSQRSSNILNKVTIVK